MNGAGRVVEARSKGKNKAPQRNPARTVARLRAAFAFAISMDGKAMLYADGGTNAGLGVWASLAHALGSRRPFFVRLTPAILAVDGDDASTAPLALMTLAVELEQAGEQPVVCASGGELGRGHLFARIEDPVILEAFKARAKALGLDVRQCIRPPMAPHRSGGHSTLCHPSTVMQALGCLAPRVAGGRKELPPWATALLRTGRTSRRTYRTASEAALAITTAARRCGWSEREIAGALLHPVHRGGVHLQRIHRERGKGASDRVVGRMVARADQFLRERPAMVNANSPAVRDARRSVQWLRELAAGMAWSGRGGATDRAVLEQHLEAAHRTGSLDYGLSDRLVAEGANITRRAVVKVHRRLEAAGWLTRTSTGVGRTAGTFTVQAPQTALSFTITLRSPPPALRDGSGEREGRRTPDAFAWAHRRRCGLGLSTLRVFSLLGEQAVEATRLALSLTMRAQQVRRHLLRLEKRGLAARVRGAWIRGDGDLEAVAGELGVAGCRTGRQTEHRGERSLYQAGRALAAQRHKARQPKTAPVAGEQPTLRLVPMTGSERRHDGSDLDGLGESEGDHDQQTEESRCELEQ